MSIPDSWYELAEKIKVRKENEEKIKLSGGDKFKQLEARLKDPETGKLGEDIVIYAIRRIKNLDEAKDFFDGYVLNIKENLKKYPLVARKDPENYARGDMYYALGYFCTLDTHKLWNKVLE